MVLISGKSGGRIQELYVSKQNLSLSELLILRDKISLMTCTCCTNNPIICVTTPTHGEKRGGDGGHEPVPFQRLVAWYKASPYYLEIRRGRLHRRCSVCEAGARIDSVLC